MTKEKKIFSYVLGWLLVGYIIFVIGTNNVFAATFDTFDVTWYYRNKSDESTLLNVVKGQDTALYASTNEYVNGYTTRLEQTFSKDIQYIINYELQMSFSPEQELVYRSDTLDRIINYSYTDSDFKILNVTATEDWNRSSSIGDTFLTIKVSMQVLALNNTNAIRFGVYTTNNISIGFYNHTEQIDYYLLDNISIEENANATIIDQNNQIISGQDGINNNIENSTNTITGEINDMEQSIIDSNKETQEVIKDQFNTCRESNNLLSNDFIQVLDTTIKVDVENLKSGTYTFKYNGPLASQLTVRKIVNGNISDINYIYNSNQITFTLTEDLPTQIEIYVHTGISLDQIKNPMLNKGNTPLPYEPYGEEFCNNKIDDTNNKLDGIQGALTDSSAPNTSGLENSAGWLPAGPLDSILNLPLTMLNSLTNSLNKTCSPLNLTLPYVNKNIQIPCLSAIFAQITGVNGLWTWVGTIASILILYNYLLNLYAWVDRVLTLRAEFDEAMGADMANWGRL